MSKHRIENPSIVTSGYYQSPWSGEDGGPHRLQAVTGIKGLDIQPGEKLTTVSRRICTGNMVVLRDPGQVYLMHVDTLRDKIGMDCSSHVELLDPTTLKTVKRSIGHINGLSRVDILTDCVDRTCRPVEVSIYCPENPVRGVGHAIPIRSILNERAQPLVPRGFPGFLASGVLLVWNPSQRKAAMPQAALCSVAPAMAESVFPVLSGAGDPESGR